MLPDRGISYLLAQLLEAIVCDFLTSNLKSQIPEQHGFFQDDLKWPIYSYLRIMLRKS